MGPSQPGWWNVERAILYFCPDPLGYPTRMEISSEDFESKDAPSKRVMAA